MIKLLHLASLVPYPPTDGGRVGVYNTARQFVRRGVHVQFAAPRADLAQAGPFLEMVHKFHPLDIESRYRIIGGLRNVISRLPYNIEKYHTEAALNQLRTITCNERFDVIQVESLHMAWYAVALKREFGIPIVLRQHNFHSNLMRRYYEKISNPIKRSYVRHQWLRMCTYEPQTVKEFDAVATITDLDANALRQIVPTLNCITVPAGFDEETLFFEKPTMQNTILFLINYEWIPNIDAYDYFISEVLPLVKRENPGVKTLVVGKGTHRIPLSKRVPDVEVVGYLDDLNYVAKLAPVAIVPLRIAGGMRVKVVELMAKGLAVVSTSIGAEGIDAMPDRDIVIADTSAELAVAINRLLASPDTCASLGKNGRALVEQRYSWRHSGDLFYKIIEEVAANTKIHQSTFPTV